MIYFYIFLRNSTVTPYDFFTVAAKLCLSILPMVDLYMQSSSFFRRLPKCAPQTGTVDPTFIVVVFGVFSFAHFSPYAMAKSTEAFIFPSINPN